MPFENELQNVRAEVQQGTSLDTLEFWVTIDGEEIGIGTPFWLTLYDPSGAIIRARTQGNGIGADNDRRMLLTQAWPAATYPLGEDYFAIWEFTFRGANTVERQSFDVVKQKLDCMLGKSVLLTHYPDLENHIRAVLPSANYNTAQILAPFCRAAWSQLCDRIRSNGKRPSLILDKVRLINPSAELALHMICNALTRDVGDIWDKRSDRHYKNYEVMFGALGELKYDVDEDNVVSPGEVVAVTRRRFWV